MSQEEVAPHMASPEPNSEPSEKPVQARKDKWKERLYILLTENDVPPSSISGLLQKNYK